MDRAGRGGIPPYPVVRRFPSPAERAVLRSKRRLIYGHAVARSSGLSVDGYSDRQIHCNASALTGATSPSSRAVGFKGRCAPKGATPYCPPTVTPGPVARSLPLLRHQGGGLDGPLDVMLERVSRRAASSFGEVGSIAHAEGTIQGAIGRVEGGSGGPGSPEAVCSAGSCEARDLGMCMGPPITMGLVEASV